MAIIIYYDKDPSDNDFEPGDVVEVLEDGADIGKRVVGNPRFKIREVPGVPAARLKYLKDPIVEDVEVDDGFGKRITTTREVKRRRYKFADRVRDDQPTDKASGTKINDDVLRTGRT